MTNAEKEIVMAYIRTRKLEGNELLEFQKYVEDIVGEPVSMDKIKNIADENKKILEDSIMALCKEDNSETKWIPVAEKLPEKECDCLVTARHRYTEVVSCSYYPDMRSKWFLDNGGDSKNVIAWMPLPEPYKPESEE